MTPGGTSVPQDIEIYKEKIFETIKKYSSHKGEEHPRAKLSNDEVIEIRNRYIRGETINQIYQDYKNIYSNKGTFTRIVLGNSYKSVGNIPKKEDIKYSNSKLNKEQVKEIRNKYLTTKTSYVKLGKEYGVSASTIQNVIQRKSYNNIE